MDQDKDFYSGYLLLPPQGKIILRKSLHQKYCLLYKFSKFGIERLEVYDTLDDIKKGTTPRIITLENCIKITSKSPNMFTVITKSSQYEFATITEYDLAGWVAAFQSVAFKDDVSKITSIEEDNDLYCSSGEGVFSVTLSPSDASKRCGLEPKNYTLVLTSTAIQLRNSGDNKLLYTWPYCFIRRYGYRSGKFTFEAGRKCDTGEGVFHLEHSNQQEIFRCLSSKMKSMKKILSGETTNTLLDCGDNQFHAALSMEARSRSPLPPSPTSSTRMHDVEINTSTQSSVKSLISFAESMDSSKNIRGPLPKPRPVKPPRKNLPGKEYERQNSNSTYEPILLGGPKNKDNYDQIEYRKEAWRTLGLDKISHTESISDLNEELVDYISWGAKSQENLNAQEAQPVLKTTKILTSQISSNDESYDKLQFFGSTSKLSNNESGYKQVSPAPVLSCASTPSWNDYDEVETFLQEVRLADDSHLGYGVIRKQHNKQVADQAKVSHKLYNDTAYAIVSKPKRV